MTAKEIQNKIHEMHLPNAHELAEGANQLVHDKKFWKDVGWGAAIALLLQIAILGLDPFVRQAIVIQSYL